MLDLLQTLFFCAAIQGAMSAALELFMREGMILGWYLPKLAKWLVKRAAHRSFAINAHIQTIVELNKTDEPIKPLDELYIELAQRYCYLYKPMGGCIFCLNCWLAFGSFWLMFLILPEISIGIDIVLFFSYIFLTCGFLKIFLND